MKRYTLLSILFAMIITYCYGSDEKKKESDGYVWTLRITTDSIAEALDASGQVIIPAERGYRYIEYWPLIKGSLSTLPCFRVSYNIENDFVGICNLNGEEIIPTFFKDVAGFKSKELSYYQVMTLDSLYGIYDEAGRMIIMPRYYDNPPIIFKGSFTISNRTLTEIKNNPIDASDAAFSFVSMPVSNPIKDYYKQQNLLTNAYEKNIQTDDLLQEAIALEEGGKHVEAIDKLTDAIKKKPSSLAYYHRGKCYYQTKKWKSAQEDLRFVFFLDDATPDILVKADSILFLADTEQMSKKIKRGERFRMVYHIIGAFSDAMAQSAESLNSTELLHTSSTSSGYGTTSSFQTSEKSASIKAETHSNDKTHTRSCYTCGRDGKCRGKYHCHGTGVCNWCNGQGFTIVPETKKYDNDKITCVNCNGSGKCTFCKGTGKCSRCKGTGFL
ncbi:MAG: hypothetical protein IJ700_08180 [Bacteroidaceae bacterium]|nr:hypothetical protein [Bacteroidaceae bacterium]